jgi:hypothetical protein
MAFIIIAHARYLQTLEAFTAPNPWSGKPEEIFCLDDFVMAATWDPDAPLAPDSLRARLMEHRLGIRPQGSGDVHILPCSLAKLWKERRVPLGELPRLLAGLEAQKLSRLDYEEDAVDPARLWLNRIVWGVVGVALLYWAAMAIKLGNTGALGAAGVLAALLCLICFPLDWMYRRRRRRRAAQRDWALAQVALGPRQGVPQSQAAR